MVLKKITVSGNTLMTFDRFDGTDSRTCARRLLAYEDGVHDVDEGGRDRLTAYFDADAKVINWEPPAGWQIARVSTFESGATAVGLAEDEDA